MRIYIIHPSSDTENYIDKTLQAEQYLRDKGHHIMNPLPDQANTISDREMHTMYGHKMRDCDAVYAMNDWSKHEIGNAEMAELMIRKKTIVFEK